MTTYKYTTVREGEIRILSVLPAEAHSDPIRVAIQHARLPPSCFGSQHDDLAEYLAECGLSDLEKPDYLALSYVWGPASDPKLAYVDLAPEGADTISITNNLDVALRHVRRKTKPVMIWIDAICIDQGNIEERGLQVSIMDTIYTSARGVIVWLGPEENGSHQVLERLAWAGERLIPQDNGSILPNPDGPTIGPDEADWLALTQPIPGDKEQTNDLIAFFERPWFGRLWIRQEIALAQQAVVLCGQTRLPWEDFQNAANCCARKGIRQTGRELLSRFVQIRETIMNVCELFSFTTPYSYSILRWDHQGVKFTDPRDTIYAVMSMLDSKDAALDIQPDYTLTTAELFEKVCLRILEYQRQTYFLYSCELATTITPNLPSWVPDWATPPGTKRLDTNWSACGFLSAQGSYLGNGVLRVAGVEVDKIDIVKGRWPGRPWNFADFVDVVWDCYPGDEYIDSVYREGETYADAYCRALMMDKFRDVFHPPKEDGTIKLAYTKVKAAMQKIWSLGDDWDDYDGLREDAEVYSVFQQCGHWKNRCFFRTEEGWLGMAPAETQLGDVVGVILGCEFPLVLRREKGANEQWNVVGACYAHGWMSGQAIYGEDSSRVYRQVELQELERDQYVDGNRVAMQEIATGEVVTDPAEVLEKMLGVKPSVWTRRPHRLEVSANILKEAGVKLREFDLV